MLGIRCTAVAGPPIDESGESRRLRLRGEARIGFFGREWGPLTASAMLAIVPILIAFALLGRHIVSGLTKGAVKG